MSASYKLPLRLQTLDLIGIEPPPEEARNAERVLSSVYGIMQIVFAGVPDLRDKGRLDASIAALLRDATLSVAACLVTARQGLYEPTMRVSRGVLEARLYVERLRTSDDGDRLANLLAIDRLFARKRQLEDQIKAKLRAPDDPFIQKHLSDISHALENTDLNELVPEFEALKKEKRYWHGFKSIRQLAEALEDSGSYHLVYAPASAFFVHPGDPDTHLLANEDAVSLKPLLCDDEAKIDSVEIMTAQEAHRLLSHAAQPWRLGGEIRLAIDKLLPLTLIAAARPDLAGEEFTALESQSGIPRAEWHDLVSVSFDWSPSTPPSGKGAV